jgi:hypothetical protein
LKGSGYAYYLTEEKNKTILSIQITKSFQLDIPLYHKRFQQMMPHLLETIQLYAETIKKQKMKVLISNSNTQFLRWIQSK